MPIPFEIQDFEDYEHFDGDKAFEGKSPSIDNPITSLKEKIAAGHMQNALSSDKFSGTGTRKCFIKQDTLFRNNNTEDEKEDVLETTELGYLPTTTPVTKNFQKLELMKKRAKFTPPPKLFSDDSGDEELESC